MTSKQTPVAVAALYKFVQLDDYIDLKPAVLAELEKRSIRGTLLLAEEGINGTISGIETDLLDFLNWLQKDPRFSDLDYKLSYHCLLYTSPSPRDRTRSRMPSSA